MSKQAKITSGGINTTSILGIAFVILRLCGVIHWPWLWVTTPFWIPLAIILAILAFAMVMLGIGYLLSR